MPSGYEGCDLLTKEGVWYRGSRADSVADYMRAYRAKNGNQYNEVQKKRYAEDPEFRERHRKLCLGNSRRRKYGVGNAEVEEMLRGQDGECMICMTPIDWRAAVDHDHETGAVRGMLCHSCNKGLGHFKDDPELIRAAVWYLTRQPS